ncbi:CBS domain-containing protein [Candidatus Saccharibacteria bacterium]|nr:CBS domain-containing protein [Candidatus Saccharibacteria bacterium]
MVSYVAAVALALLVCLAISWQKAYFFLPAKELKRQAEAGDPVAATLWRVVAYSRSLRVFLWLVIGFGSAGSFLLLSNVAPPVLALIAIVGLLWLMFAWLPYSRLHPWSVKTAATATPVIAWIVITFDPVFRRIASLANTRLSLSRHTGIFEREDLIELLEKQKAQTDSRLSLEELELATNALHFGDKTVRSAMTARGKVKAVSADEAISPVFLDELHKTGHDRFPVYKGKVNNFVGTLYLHRLTDVNEGKGAKGHVRDYMHTGVIYVHEKDSLAQALHAYYFSKFSLFIVVDKHQDYVGILTVDDILHTLLGKPGELEFVQFDSKSAVAAKRDKPDKPVQDMAEESVEPENASENTEEVVK